MRITSARITDQPRSLFDPMPVVYVTTEDGAEQRLFDYFPDEISFKPEDFIGLTVDEARSLKFQRDLKYLKYLKS
jgi:hypothetical protein